MQAIQSYLSGVLSKRSVQAVCLWGELGVGKTHLVKSLLHETPCRSFGLRAAAPSTALTRVMPRPEDFSYGDSQIWEALERGEAVPPKQLAETVAKVLAELAPVVLHLEDLHEAEPKSLEWVAQLVLLLPKLRGVGLLATSRTEMPGFQNHPVQRLNLEAFKGLLQTQQQSPLPQEGMEWIYNRSLGNPLFGLEYLTYLTRQGYIWSDGVRWHWRVPAADFVPPTLEALIYDWMTHNPSAKPLLETRAVLPDGIDQALWVKTSGLEATSFAQQQRLLERAGWLRGTEWTHPLMAQIIRGQIASVQRPVYAQRALTALQANNLEPSPQLIADARLGKTKTLQIYQQLAEEAKRKQDMARAGHWLALASEQSNSEEQTVLALEAAQLLRHTDLARATELAQTAAYTPPHDREAVYLCAELLVAQGDTEGAETLLGLLSSEERRSQRWWETLIRLHFTTHANHTEVLRLWGLHPEFQPNADPEVILFVSAVQGQRGQFESAFELSRPLLRRTDLEPYVRCRILELQAVLNFLQGNFLNSEEFNAQAIALARMLDRPAYLGKLLRKYAVDAENLNQFALATARYRETLAVYAEFGPELDFAYTQSALGRLLVDLGEFEEAEVLLLQAQKVLETSEHIFYRCDCQNMLTLLYLEWQPPYGASLALKHGRNTLNYARETKNQQMTQAGLVNLSQAEARFGNPQTALEMAHQAIDEQYTGPSAVRKAWGQSALAWALEASQKPSEALEVWAEAQTVLTQNEMHKMAHRYGLEMARLMTDIELARSHYQWFVEQGLLGGAKVALRYFPELEAKPAEPLVKAPVGLRLNLLGTAQIEKDGERVAYRGRKRLEFLVYLLETRVAGRSEATLLELMDTLYPGVGETEAKAVIKQLVYLLRNQLGSEAIISTNGGYALGAIHSDVETFLKSGEPELWRGAYLTGLEQGYLPGVREALMHSLSRCVGELLGHNPTEAGRLGQIWLEMEPYDHSAIRLTLQAYINCGEQKTAERIYRQSRERLEEVGERLPNSSQDFLRAASTS